MFSNFGLNCQISGMNCSGGIRYLCGMSARLPIIYHPHYDIRLMGLERLHPFDSVKYGRVVKFLKKEGLLTVSEVHAPEPVTDAQLLTVHTQRYLDSLRKSRHVASVAEMPLLANLPHALLRRSLLRAVRSATGGTLLGTDLARQHGWSINLSGGYHHAKADAGSGFCFFSDIALGVYHALAQPGVEKAMVVDLDAHQGNGFEAIFADDPRIATLDIYNGDIWPMDHAAAKYIRYRHPIGMGTADEAYLALLRRTLPAALDAEKPGFLLYNAGTDIYKKDPLGGLNVTAAGILARDEFVFAQAMERDIPILMVLSGGYHKDNAEIIASSIRYLLKKF